MKRVFSFVLILAMISSVISMNVYGANYDYVTVGDSLIRDGGFQSSTGDWNTQGVLTRKQSVDARTGYYMGVVSGRSSLTVQPYINISLTGGKTYLFSAWTRLESADYEGSKIHLNVSGGETISDANSSVSASASEWREMYRTVAVETDETVRFSFANYTDTNLNFYLDDISIYEIDTSKLYPASATLNGAKAIGVPENGTSVIRLRCDVYNQNGAKEGLHSEQNMDSWYLESPAVGVSVNSKGEVSADYRAEAGTVTVIGEKYSEYLNDNIVVSREIEVIPGLRNDYNGNLFANGDFESENTALWQGSTFITVSDNAYDGRYCAYLPNGGKIGQGVWLRPGKAYYISAYVKAESGTVSFETDSDSVTVSTSSANAGVWNKVCAVADTSAITEDEYVIISAKSSSSAAFYIDNLFIHEMDSKFNGCDGRFTMSFGGSETQFLKDGQLTVSAELENGYESKNIKLLAALYNTQENGLSLADVAEMSDISLASGEKKTVIFDKKINVTDSKTQTLRFFVWDSELTPYAKADERDDRDEVVYHVSPDGVDDPYGASKWTGTEQNPVKNIGQALSKLYLRATSWNEPYPEDGIRIVLHEGVYPATLTFSGETYSGTEKAPLVIEAAPGENVTVTGSVSLDSSAFVPANEEAKARLADQSAAEHLMQLTLGESIDVGEMHLPGAYPLPWQTGTKTMPELIINGEVQTLSRYPNEGHMNLSKVVDTGATSEEIANYTEETKSKGFVIQPEDKRFLKWANAKDALLYGYWRYPWADQTVPVKTIDTENGTITSAYPASQDIRDSGYFYAFNLLEEIDSPGEYYIDKETKILYVYPPEGVNLSDADVTLTQKTGALFHFTQRASNIRVRNITIGDTRGKGMWIESYGKNIVFENCTFRNTGDTAGMTSGDNNGFINCTVYDTNGGLQVHGGDSYLVEKAQSFVENCSFDNFSRITHTYNGAITLGGCGNIAKGNEIKNAPHLGIQFWGSEHLIENNHIHDILKYSDDMAAIYTGSSWVSRGTKIRNNFIHSLRSEIPASAGVFGVYLDNLFSGVEITNNIFADFSKGAYGVFINGGRDNKVNGNIFVNLYGDLQVTDIGLQTGKDLSGFYSGLEKADYRNEPYKNYYPEVYTILDNEEKKPVDNEFSRNLTYYTPGTFQGVEASYTNIQGEAKALVHMGDNVKTTENPGFETIGENDYVLGYDSGIYEKIPGFKQLR